MENSPLQSINNTSIFIDQPVIISQTITPAEYLSYIFGSLYLILWSLSFYPQLYENYKRQNCHGLSYEYVVLQPFAYFFYCVYSFVGRVEQIGRRKLDRTGRISDSDREQIDKADVFFAGHALLMSAAILTQYLILPRGSSTAIAFDQKHLKKQSMYFIGVLSAFVMVTFAVEVSMDEGNSSESTTFSPTSAAQRIIQLPLLLQTQMLAGYAAVLLHVGKYIPQVLRNQERKSTVGLSPKMVLLDLVGSTFCLLQVVSDYIFLNGQQTYEDSSSFRTPNTQNLNLLKLFMTTLTIASDFCFMMQHYIQFKKAVEQDRKKRLYEIKHEQRQEMALLIDKRLKDMPYFESEQHQDSIMQIIVPNRQEDAHPMELEGKRQGLYSEQLNNFEQTQPAQQYISQNGHFPFKQQYDQDVELLDQSNNRSRSNIWWQNPRNSSQFNGGAIGLQQEYKYK